MPANQYGEGIEVGNYIPGGFESWRNERGGWEARATYAFNPQSLDDPNFVNRFRAGVRATELDESLPDYYSRVYINGAPRISRGPGEIWEMVISFAGYSGFDSDPDNPQPEEPTYVLKGTTQERPITDHPDVTALFAEQRELIAGVVEGKYWYDSTTNTLRHSEGRDPDFATGLQPDAGAATDFCVLATDGIITYTFPAVTWTKTWNSENPLRNAQINNLGRIDTPEGDPPEPQGGRDWMLIDYSQELTGRLYNLRLEWELSERGGHNELLYGA